MRGHSKPPGQSPQCALTPSPSAAHVPASQPRHSVWLASYRPAAHLVHDVLASLTTEPGPHGMQARLVLVDDQVPSSHGRCTGSGEADRHWHFEPAGQSKQSSATPSPSSAHRPSAHAVQPPNQATPLAVPSVAHRPAGHALHAVRPTSNRPASHLVHGLALISLEIAPTAHAVHTSVAKP